VAARVLSHLSHDPALTLEQLLFELAITFVTVVLIIVRAYKIRGHIVALAEVDEVFDPFTLRGCWTTDLE
jgi:hypothetical protein